LQSAKSLQERTEEEVAGVLHLLDLKEGQEVLDLPCGYGRHSLGLAKKCIKVIGGDINSEHLNAAKTQLETLQKTNELKAEVAFEIINMLNVPFENTFDAVINMFYSFGFFDTDEENEEVLRQFYKALKP
jgi:SAM-dependent methyltransferase